MMDSGLSTPGGGGGGGALRFLFRGSGHLLFFFFSLPRKNAFFWFWCLLQLEVFQFSAKNNSFVRFGVPCMFFSFSHLISSFTSVSRMMSIFPNYACAPMQAFETAKLCEIVDFQWWFSELP